MLNDEIFGNPVFDPERCFISSKSTLIGIIMIEEGVFVGPNVCIRADEGTPFKICKGTNIQDGVVIHGLFEKYIPAEEMNFSVYIGSHCTIAHQALIHGPVKIDKKTFVGFRAIIHNSTIGRNCNIGFGAIVKNVIIADRREVPDGMVVNNQSIADNLAPISEEMLHFNKEVVDYNRSLINRYRERRKRK
jgi:sulfate permease, SulP family